MARINWHEEFDRLDMENMKHIQTIKILKMQNLLCDVARMCKDEEALRNILGFCAGYMDMRFVDNGFDDMRIESRRAAGNE